MKSSLTPTPLIVAFPFRHHATHMHEAARRMLADAGFEIHANDSGRALSRAEQKAMIRDAYAVVAGTEPYDAEMLEGCDNLRVLIRFGVGTDNFDLTRLKEMGVQVGVIANYNAVEEFTLMLILSCMKNLPQLDQAVRKGEWARFPMCELAGRTVGIVGFGRIGRRLAELLVGFKVRILAYDPFMNEEETQKRGVISVGFEELLRESDVVSLHLPATPETEHLINDKTIAQMKDGAYLVNTARGKLVDEAALVRALRAGKLRAAGIDVYEHEPVTADNPLFELNNVSVTPHTAAITFETNYNGAFTAAQSVLNVLNGGRPVYPVI